MLTRILRPAAIGAAILGGGVAPAAEGTLAFLANGESLATSGFVAPETTRDGWELRFDRILVTLADIAAMQTDPPYDAEAGGAPAATVTAVLEAAAPVTIDLTATDEDGRVALGTLQAPAGHYNAVTWSVVPAPGGDFPGLSMVLAGTATRRGEAVAFTLTSAATHVYTCGEYVGESRKGILAAGGAADLELTFHLDHIFGRGDRAPDDPMNLSARGFDVFAAGGTQAIDLAGLHIGHVGEGHCAVTFR